MQAFIRPAIVLCVGLAVAMVSLQIWYIEAQGARFHFWGLPRGLGMAIVGVLPLVAAVGVGWSVRVFWKAMQPPPPPTARVPRPAAREAPPR